MKLNNNVYDVLKWIVMVLLPAFGVLYGALAPVWGFQNADKVLTTLSAVTVFLGAVIGVSTVTYNKPADDEND